MPMRCPPTHVPSQRSATMSSISGDAPCASVVSGIVCDVGTHGKAGRALAAQTPDISPVARSTLPRQTPKVGAVCGNSARMRFCAGGAQ